MKAWLNLLVFLLTAGLTTASINLYAIELIPVGNGPHTVGSTNLRVTEQFTNFSDQEIRDWLAGFKDDHERRFFSEHLAYPEDAWVLDVEVPNEPEVYGVIAGETLPVVMFLNYPTTADNPRPDYTFPFPDSNNTDLHHMQAPGEGPLFAEEQARYPLVLLSHGRNVHGIWEIDHARRLASHGYITLTMNFGDLRIDDWRRPLLDVLFRPLAAKAALDHVLSSKAFGDHIDHARIATSGHSLGGFTSLAVAGGHYLEGSRNYHHPGIKAVVAAAPWVGGSAGFGSGAYYLFGENNTGLSLVKAPVFSVYGTRDQATPSATILPALEHLSGPRYVVELVDQPHIFEGGSWEDLGEWELLFLAAYLKDDPRALELLNKGSSMGGGNVDTQHFQYQKGPVSR